MICKEFFPFSIVEDEEFKKFVSMLCPTYHLPSRKTLSNALLSSTFNDLVIKIKNELAISTAVCLTSDGWTSNNNVNFYALTAHFIDKNTKLKSYLLECSEFENRHTAQNIANWVAGVANEFGIRPKIVAIVTDNASNMKAAATILKLRHIGCFAHSLNLIVQHAISSSIQSIVNVVKDTVMFFKKSSFAQSKLTEMQINLKTEELKLKQDVPTYEMLQRFIKNKESIISSLALLGKPLLLTERDWNVIDKTVEVLKVFHEVTTEVSSEQTISLSKVGVLIKLMGRQMKMQKEKNTSPCLQIDLLLDSILKGLSDRFGAISQNKILLQSTLLDPRFKRQGFTDSITFRECYNDVVSAIKVLGQTTQTQPQQPLPSTSSSSIWQEFDEKINSLQGTYNPESAAIVELDKYLAEEYLPRNHDPLLWWEFRKLVYPNLYKIMIKRLSIPATSVPCELIFSKAGQICSEKRSRLTSEKLTDEYGYCK